MSDRSRLVFAAVMGLLAVAASAAYLSGRERELVGAAAPAEVCVAIKDILANTPIEDTSVKRSQVPSSYLQPLAVADCREALGHLAAIPIPTGAQLVSTALMDGRQAGLATLLPRSSRAVTIGVDSVTSVGGLIRPGNLVDVFATIVFARSPAGGTARLATDERTEVRLLLERVPVLAVGQEYEGLRQGSTGPDQQRGRALAETQFVNRDVRTVTLSVTAAQAQEIVLAQRLGRLTLALRPNLDGAKVNLNALDAFGLFKVPHPIRVPVESFDELHGPTFRN